VVEESHSSSLAQASSTAGKTSGSVALAGGAAVVVAAEGVADADLVSTDAGGGVFWGPRWQPVAARPSSAATSAMWDWSMRR
jgi:hypothetical protein